MRQAAAGVPYCLGLNDVGRLVFGVTNFGRVGVGRGVVARLDCFTGVLAPLGEYPKGSNTTYLYKGALWIGAVVGRDTLVTTANQFNNDNSEMYPVFDLLHRSVVDFDSPDRLEAVSEEDFVAVYVDTVARGPYPTFDALEGRRHKPLNLEVTQRSYAWSYGHTDDFVIIVFEIRNIGDKVLRDAYIGMYWDGDVHPGQRLLGGVEPWGVKGTTGGRDDLSGYLFTSAVTRGECEFMDTLGIAWTADNDGDPLSGGGFQVPHVAGVRFLHPAASNRPMTYNWWVYNYSPDFDFGPQSRGKYRFMGNGTGTPYGDRRFYWLLSNDEVDYDQAFARTIGSWDPVWVMPSQRAAERVVLGVDVQQLLSSGPYVLLPGGSISVPIAFVAGEEFHSVRSNFSSNLRNRYNPDAYYRNVDFSSLIDNAVTADWVYDIPGYDTDGDEYRGEFVTCEGETTYFRGDGIPDLKAAEAPPAPRFWVTPTLGGLKIRFNGTFSERTKDIFSNLIDFEGYRIYIARDPRETSFSLVAQYDRENYDKYVYSAKRRRNPGFQQLEDPFTLEQLRCLYGRGTDPCSDSGFDPLRFTSDYPYVHPRFPDSIFYFDAHDFNQDEWGVSTPIRKVCPEEPEPGPLDQARPEQLTAEGLLKYYEYEFEIRSLLSSVPYFIAVTAYDVGSPQSELAPLESSKTGTALSAYPNSQSAEAPDKIGNVYVYPNPYRGDAGYRDAGYEGRGEEDRSNDRVRKITFANLPARCTIRIFSLDGDLIRAIEHDFDRSDPNSSYQEWDLVTRNTQMVVSGLYYWTVEDEHGGVQIGKLVILF
ncbi:MAG TPA: hypothetical protein VN285_08715 [Candidatus Deferrimicrobium sp.]|nr:hypothetical protein [Candidatus Deferrimicrobium sp.]